MRDGSEKAISKIEIGDSVYGGGIVFATYVQAWQGPLYDYFGVIVTGAHPVFEDGKFIRVKNSKGGAMSKVSCDTVYDFSCINHRIVVGNITFADYAETDDPTLSYEQMILKLNDKRVGDVVVC